MKAAAPIAAALAASLLAARAAAHEVGLSRGEYRVEGAAVHAELIFARRDLASLVAGLDADHDGALTAAEVTAARDAIEGALVGRVKVTGDGAPCPGTLETAALTEQDGVSVRAVYRCPARPRRLVVALAFLDDLSFGHRHLARASADAGAAEADAVLSQRTPTLALDVPAAAPSSLPPPRDASGGPGPAASPPVRRGALRALARAEAPAFLLALFASCGGLGEATRAALAFVAAAAFGLFAGARGVFMPTPAALAPAIALSLVYAGLDLLYDAARPGSPGAPPARAGRWRIAVPFGVVHGLGAAAALSSMPAVPAAPSAELAGYGAGFVTAIVVVSAALVPAALWARRRPAFAPRGLRALGAMVAAAGVLVLVVGRG